MRDFKIKGWCSKVNGGGWCGGTSIGAQGIIVPRQDFLYDLWNILLPSIGGATVVQAFHFPIGRRRRRLLLLMLVVQFLKGRRRNVSLVTSDGHGRRRSTKVLSVRRRTRGFTAHPNVVVVGGVLPRFGQSFQGRRRRARRRRAWRKTA